MGGYDPATKEWLRSRADKLNSQVYLVKEAIREWRRGINDVETIMKIAVSVNITEPSQEAVEWAREVFKEKVL
jgi:hypothetical protein